MFVRSALLAAGLVAVLAGPAAAAPSLPSGPLFAGTVAQGETDTHRFGNTVGDNPCIDLATWYRVTLTFAPTGDALTLHAGGESVTTTSGVAEIAFMSGVCTSFGIEVTGTSVAATAPYAVTVRGGLLAAGVLDPGSIIHIEG